MKLFSDASTADRRPSLPIGIMRSPGLADKIRLQFRRRASSKSLRKDPEYDSDMRPMTLREALQEVTEDETTDFLPGESPADDSDARCRFGSIDAGDPSESHAGGANLRSSIWRSLEWLKPLISRSVRECLFTLVLTSVDLLISRLLGIQWMSQTSQPACLPLMNARQISPVISTPSLAFPRLPARRN